MKVVLYMAMTANGYIAKEDGETPWSDAAWNNYYSIAKGFRAMILGRRTYEIMRKIDEFDKIGNPFTVVVSYENKKKEKNFNFVKSPKEAIALLKKKGFEKVLLGGGGSVNSSFIKDNLIDEIYIDIEPLIFGKGIKLFADGNFDRKLKLIGVKKTGNLVQAHYEVKR